MARYSNKMIFAVLDVSLIMGLNNGETDKVFFYINYSKKLHFLISLLLITKSINSLFLISEEHVKLVQ